jgi:hypothetical protein
VCVCACVRARACVHQQLSAFWSKKFISALYKDLLLPHSFLMPVATILRLFHCPLWYTTLRELYNGCNGRDSNTDWNTGMCHCQ